MSLVCFASFKGSPGTTLTALATAAAWPTDGNRRKVLLEADADGGALALRYQLPTKPGLISLAAAARRGLSKDQIWDHAQPLPGGLPVVLAPEGPEQANEVLRGSGRELGQWLSSLPDIDVIADVGRLSIGSAAFELVSAADAVLGVVRPTAIELQPAAQRMVALSNYGLRVGWVLIGEKPYTANDVSRAYGLPVVHVVERDERGAKQMEAGTSPNKLRRSSLVRSIGGLAETLSEWLHPAGAENWDPPTTQASSDTSTQAPQPVPSTQPASTIPPSPAQAAAAPEAGASALPTDAAPTVFPGDMLATPPDPETLVAGPLPDAPVPGAPPPPNAVSGSPDVAGSPGIAGPPDVTAPPGIAGPPDITGPLGVTVPPSPPSDTTPPPPPDQASAVGGPAPPAPTDGLPGIESGTPSLAILAAQRGQELVNPTDDDERAARGNGNGNGVRQ